MRTFNHKFTFSATPRSNSGPVIGLVLELDSDSSCTEPRQCLVVVVWSVLKSTQVQYPALVKLWNLLFITVSNIVNMLYIK